MIEAQKPPLCQLCMEKPMVFIGRMNGTDIYICPKCDRINKK